MSAAYERLAADLRSAVRGEVRFDAGTKAMYSNTGSNYRQVPIGVVIPLDADDVVAAVAVCRAHEAPVLPRGGGTSLAGQSCNVAVIVNMSRNMRGLLELDPERERARVEPGIVLDALRDAAEEHGLTFAPDPSTHKACTLGGMIGNNSCGVHSLLGGKTVENVEALEILTYDGLRMTVGATSEDELGRIVVAGGRRGEIYGALRDLRDEVGHLVRERYPRIPRRISGYNLDELLEERGFDLAKALVGTEGTCVTVLEATLRLVPSPPCRELVAIGFDDVYAAADAVPAVLEHGPIGLEGIDDVLIDDMKHVGIHPSEVQLLPDGRGWLLAEFGADTIEEAESKCEELVKALRGTQGFVKEKHFEDQDEVAKLWEVRESGLAATAHVPGEDATWEGWEDAAVPPERLGDYLRGFRKLLDRYGYVGALYGHFGQGCIHTRTDFDLRSREGIARFRSFIEDAADLVLAHDGSLSGEHGDSQSRAELLPKMFGDELVDAFRRFKSIWDPQGKMNPGKVVDPYPLDSNLRIGPNYRPRKTTTAFDYTRDDGNFAKTTLRCVGVGLCRKEGGGTMCPSYMVTKEEAYSTRGRARLLFEMLEGETIRDGWRSEAVREALDLCLACKACRTECPVNVDMATYKAEFLSHYYEGRLRPRHAYAFGLIHWWARLAARAPGLVAVFRDELLELLPHDEDAKRLAKQSFVLSELLERTDGWDPGRLPKRALVHGHCYQKALMGMSAEETVLKQLDVEYELLDAGCCGMAGAFGFEREHYAISIACGERALLPAVRAADADTVVVANGFSCREQIAQTTDRKAVHLAELIRMGVGNA